MRRALVALVALLGAVGLAGCGTAAPAGPAAVPITVVTPPPVATPDSAAPDRVMVIRHAEKPDGTAPGISEDGTEDDSSLTAVGWQRAHALVGLFDPPEGDPQAGLARPEAIYAAGVTDEGEGQRTRETVAPLADALGLPVRTEYGKGDEKKLMREVLKRSGTTLISWQHGEIPALAEAFDPVTPAPPEEWPSDRFDVVWTFTRTTDGWHFTQTPELLLPQDRSGVIEN